MGLSRQDSISKYGTEAYTGWGETEAMYDARNKGVSAPSSSPAPTITSANLPSVLDNYQNDQFQTVTAPDLKIPTADELKASLTPTTPAPTPINRNAINDQMKTTLGVTDLETNLKDINTQIDTTNADLRATTGAEEGKPVALNVMAGRMTEEQRQAATKIDYLTVQKNSLVSELTTKYNAINTYVQYAGLDYNDAVQAYQNDFNQNVQVQNLLSGYRQEAWKYATDAISINNQVKQNNIDNARANLTTMTNAITSGQMNYASLPDDQKLQIQKLEIQSGMPVGTITNLQMSPKDKILGFNSDNTEAWVIGVDGNMKVMKTGMTKPSTAGQQDAQKLANARAMMEQKLSELGGSDGLVSPTEWKQQKSIWIQVGFSADDFDATFREQHVNESAPSDYGLKPYTGTLSTADELIKMKQAGVIK